MEFWLTEVLIRGPEMIKIDNNNSLLWTRIFTYLYSSFNYFTKNLNWNNRNSGDFSLNLKRNDLEVLSGEE